MQGVIPGDYNYDGLLDMLVVTQQAAGQSYTIYVFVQTTVK